MPTLVRTLVYDTEEMARRGALGGQRTAELHDPNKLTEPARRAFAARFEQAADPEAAKREYYSTIGKLGAARRRAQPQEVAR
jgi:hypothetical protein